MNETFKKHNDTSIEITQKDNDKVVVESFDATLAQITELESAIAELQANLVPLYARRDKGVELGLKTQFEVDEENRIAKEERIAQEKEEARLLEVEEARVAEEARLKALKASLDEVVE